MDISLYCLERNACARKERSSCVALVRFGHRSSSLQGTAAPRANWQGQCFISEDRQVIQTQCINLMAAAAPKHEGYSEQQDCTPR
jgi:hypothetical protein